MLKPPRGGINYKKEIVAIKKGIFWEVKDSKTPSALNVFTLASTKKDLCFKKDLLFDTTNAGKNEVYVHFYTASTGNRPISEIATMTVHNYRTFESPSDLESGFNEAKNRYKLPKGYEAFDKAKGKWTRSIKVTGNMTVDVREIGNAKYDAKTEDNLKSGSRTASKPVKLEIKWGKTAEMKNPGVIEVKVPSS